MTRNPHPDPAKGIFETMLVVDGHLVELEAHMARLGTSLKALFGEEAPEEGAKLARERARGIPLGRLRLTVAPDGAGGLATEVVTAEVDPLSVFPSWELGVDLHSIAVENGLGAHKWADRTLLEDEETQAPAGTTPLLLSGEGTVLEASRASVFVACRGRLRTPPTDGRILPGIARKRVLEIAGKNGIDAGEAELIIDDLIQADEVFQAGSVRGVEPVRSVDGTDLHPRGELSERIAGGLRRRWLG